MNFEAEEVEKLANLVPLLRATLQTTRLPISPEATSPGKGCGRKSDERPPVCSTVQITAEGPISLQMHPYF